jgi:hypothetical protein
MLLASRYRVLYRHSGQRDAARVNPSAQDKAMEHDIDVLSQWQGAYHRRAIPGEIVFTAPAAGEQKAIFKETA